MGVQREFLHGTICCILLFAYRSVERRLVEEPLCYVRGNFLFRSFSQVAMCRGKANQDPEKQNTTSSKIHTFMLGSC